MSDAVMEVNSDTFDDVVSDGLVLVDVWGPDCQPCIELEPHVEEIAEDRSELKVAKVDASDNRRWCMDHQVMGLPTFLLFRDGEEVARISDPDLGPNTFKEWLNEELEELT
ncbi:MAG TPA: thioredoxin family protein [Nitriliruptorales bacterium]|nr:thioredoxin family protein [Nitriliruptorales bacterium]